MVDYGLMTRVDAEAGGESGRSTKEANWSLISHHRSNRGDVGVLVHGIEVCWVRRRLVFSQSRAEIAAALILVKRKC